MACAQIRVCFNNDDDDVRSLRRGKQQTKKQLIRSDNKHSVRFHLTMETETCCPFACASQCVWALQSRVGCDCCESVVARATQLSAYVEMRCDAIRCDLTQSDSIRSDDRLDRSSRARRGQAFGCVRKARVLVPTELAAREGRCWRTSGVKQVGRAEVSVGSCVAFEPRTALTNSKIGRIVSNGTVLVGR